MDRMEDGEVDQCMQMFSPLSQWRQVLMFLLLCTIAEIIWEIKAVDFRK